jgi:outer membrane protein
MKRTFQVLVLAVLCLLGTDTFAQKIKLGHFNSNELMQKMPEAKQAETQLQEYVADLQAEMELMNQEYNRLMQEYEAKKDQLTDLLKANKENEIKSVVERMQNFQRQSDVSVQEKQMELMNAIVEKIKAAVAEVASENGYTYIF